MRNTIKNSDYFDVIDSETKAYILGLILSDGHVKKSGRFEFSQHVRNAKLLNLMNDEFKFEGYYNLNRKSDTFYPCIGFTDKVFTNHLKKYGVVPGKTHTLNLKGVRKHVKSDYMNSLLLGWFDGDGCIHYSSKASGNGKNTVFQISGTIDSMTDIYEYLKSIGFDVKLRKHYRDHKSNTYIVCAYSKDTILKLHDWLYKNYEGLKSKKAIFEAIKNDFDTDGCSETWYEEDVTTYNKYISNKHILNSYLIGSIMGNSCFLGPNRYRINKGDSDSNWVNTKVKLFSDYLTPVNVNNCTVNDCKQIYAYYNHKKYFKYLFKEMYRNGKKVLPPTILNKINVYSLSIWYLDKGRDVGEGIIMNTRCYTKHEVTKLSDLLRKKFRIGSSVINSSGKYILRVNKTEFINLIKSELYTLANTDS